MFLYSFYETHLGPFTIPLSGYCCVLLVLPRLLSFGTFYTEFQSLVTIITHIVVLTSILKVIQWWIF